MVLGLVASIAASLAIGLSWVSSAWPTALASGGATILLILLGFLAPRVSRGPIPAFTAMGIVLLVRQADLRGWLPGAGLFPGTSLLLIALWAVGLRRRTSRLGRWFLSSTSMLGLAIPVGAFALSGESVIPYVALLLVVLSAQAFAAGGALARIRVCPTLPRAMAACTVVVGLIGVTAIGAARSLGDIECAPTTLYAQAHSVRADLMEMHPIRSDTPHPNELWSRYRERIRDATVDCAGIDSPCPPMLYVLREMLAELGNGHTGLVIPEELGAPAITLRPVQDGVAIDWVEAGSDADRLGLEAGMRVLEVDGQAIDDAVDSIAPWRANGSAPTHRRFKAVRNLLDGPPESQVSITVSAPEPRTVTLQRDSLETLWEEQKTWVEQKKGKIEEEYEPPVHLRWLVKRTLHVSIYGFDASAVAAKVEETIHEAERIDGLLLDLRGNRGGAVAGAHSVMGHFISEDTLLGEVCLRVDESAFPEEDFCHERWISPSQVRYEGPLAVLIDEQTASASEVVAFGLCRLADARCFGRTTAGATDFGYSRSLPGAELSIASARYQPVLGPDLEGVGMEPDEWVGLTSRDLAAGRDPAFEAALAWIRKKQAEPGPASRRR